MNVLKRPDKVCGWHKTPIQQIEKDKPKKKPVGINESGPFNNPVDANERHLCHSWRHESSFLIESKRSETNIVKEMKQCLKQMLKQIPLKQRWNTPLHCSSLIWRQGFKVKCSYRWAYGSQLCFKEPGKKILFTSLAIAELNPAGGFCPACRDVSAQPD